MLVLLVLLMIMIAEEQQTTASAFWTSNPTHHHRTIRAITVLMVHATNQPIVRQGRIAPTVAPAATTVLGGIGTQPLALHARVLDGATLPPPLTSTVTLGR
jgi:hypothetical protein